MTPARWAKYGAIAAASARRTLGERAEVAGRGAFLLVILFIFSRVWDVVLGGGALAGAGPRELVWYLAVTEWCALSMPAIFLVIEADIRSGNVACQLVRPVSYVGARLAEAAGDTCARLLVLAPVATTGAWLLAGGWPSDPRGLPLAVPLGLLSSMLAVVCLTGIGLAAFWIVDTSPLMWIWQKLVFVLGGLLLPLEIYPTWLRTLAHASPFPAMMYGAGRTAFGWSPHLALVTALTLVGWIAVATGVLAWLARRAATRVTVYGG